jgi:hypothetical protein
MRPRSILSFAALLLLAGFGVAFAQSLPTGPQVVPLPAPTPSGAPLSPGQIPLSLGQIVQSQMHKRPPGIPGFYDPATGKFTPSGGIVPKRPSGDVAPNGSGLFSVDVHTAFIFNGRLKPPNTLNCTAQVEYLIGAVYLSVIGTEEQVLQTSVGAPPTHVVFGIPFGGAEAAFVKGSMACTAEDDSGESYYGDAEGTIAIIATELHSGGKYTIAFDLYI